MSHIIVTGGAGFIGSRIIKELNSRGCRNILLVDDLSDATKINNIKDLDIEDFIPKDKFMEIFMVLADNDLVESVYHMGAERSTTCTDGNYLMSNNYQYTCNIANTCILHNIPLVYASSASVYGDSDVFDDSSTNYIPNNMYAYSKLLADKYINVKTKTANIIGCRYFNVYSDGEFETHKGDMKSPTAWMKEQYNKDGKIELFEGSENFKRDFIHIDEAVNITINLMGISRSGIYNVGTGKARSFVELAKDELGIDEKDINYIPMPKELEEHYQKFTEANLRRYHAITGDRTHKV